MKLIRVIVLFTFCLVNLTAHAEAAFTVLAEDAYPLQYIENQQYKGPIAERVKQLLALSDIENYQVMLLPWARALQTAKQKSNHMIAGLVRTPEREHDYIWIGVVEQLDYYFYAEKSFAQNNEITDDNLHTFLIGTIINSATDQYLRANGFTKLSATSHADQNYEKLINGRLDLLPGSRTTFEASCKQMRNDCDRFVPVLPIKIPTKALWLAVSKHTSDELVATLKKQFTLLD